MSKLVGEQQLMRIFSVKVIAMATSRFMRHWLNCCVRKVLPEPLYCGGVCGFGANRVYHTQKLLNLSADLPIIIEVVDSQEKINAVMPRIDTMMAGGMITLEKATVIRYSHKR